MRKPIQCWCIYCDVDGGWRWQCRSKEGTQLAEASRSFRDYPACFADARRNGYPHAPKRPSRQAAWAESRARELLSILDRNQG